MGIHIPAAVSGASLPGVKATRTTVQSIPTGVFTAIEFTSELFDDGTYHDNSTNNSRCTIPAAGGGKRHRIVASVSFAGTVGGRRILEIRKNGTAVFRDERALSSGTQPMAAVFTEVPSAGDYYEVFVYQTSGSSLNTDVGYGASFLELQRLN